MIFPWQRNGHKFQIAVNGGLPGKYANDPGGFPSHPGPGRPPRVVGVGCIELNWFPTFLSPWESDRGPIRFDATKLLPFTEVAISRRGGGKIWMKPLTLSALRFFSLRMLECFMEMSMATVGSNCGLCLPIVKSYSLSTK